MKRATASVNNGLAWAFGGALASHLCWGTYPVISKLLLKVIPPFTLVCFGYVVVILVMSPILIRDSWRASLAAKSAWLLMLFGALRMVTNILSIHATRATYVQLINLSSPFAVTLLGRIFFREKIPRYTFPALTVSTIGSFLIITGGPWLVLPQEWKPTDSLGILLALCSNIFLALYVLYTRYEQATRGISAMVLFAQQCVVLVITSIIGGIGRGEKMLDVWSGLPIFLWVLFFIFVSCNLLMGNLLQISSLKKLGAALFSSFIGARLVAALVLGTLLLGEKLSSGWQVLGAAMVITAVTTYVSLQAKSG